MSKEVKITEKKFAAYEAVRSSGVTNMWDVRFVTELSGLTKEECMEIMQTYGELMEKYPDVRN